MRETIPRLQSLKVWNGLEEGYRCSSDLYFYALGVVCHFFLRTFRVDLSMMPGSFPFGIMISSSILVPFDSLEDKASILGKRLAGNEVDFALQALSLTQFSRIFFVPLSWPASVHIHILYDTSHSLQKIRASPHNGLAQFL